MRYKFRGKREDDHEWIYGSLITEYDGACYIERSQQQLLDTGALFPWFAAIEVIPETVGMFTGLTDRNGKEIYEGDVVIICIKPPLEIVYEHGSFGYRTRFGFFSFLHLTKDDFEVIGNIHENPELLEVSNETK